MAFQMSFDAGTDSANGSTGRFEGFDEARFGVRDRRGDFGRS